MWGRETRNARSSWQNCRGIQSFCKINGESPDTVLFINCAIWGHVELLKRQETASRHKNHLSSISLQNTFTHEWRENRKNFHRRDVGSGDGVGCGLSIVSSGGTSTGCDCSSIGRGRSPSLSGCPWNLLWSLRARSEPKARWMTSTDFKVWQPFSLLRTISLAAPCLMSNSVTSYNL